MPPPRAPGAPGRSAREDAAGRRGLRLRVTDPLLPLTRRALRVLRPWPLPGTQTLPLPLPHCAWVPRSLRPPLPTSSSREGESRRFQGAPRGPQVPPDVPAPRPLHGRRRAQTPATRAGFFGARCRRRDGARRISVMPGRGSRSSHCSRFCCCCWWWWWCCCCGWGWRWRLLKRLLVLRLLGSRWLLGPGLCFLVLLTDPLDHSAPAPRASLAPGTWGLRSVCVQRAAAAAAP